MRSKLVLATLVAPIYMQNVFSEEDPFEGMTYQDGFTEGISFAIAAMASKSNGMGETPYPVEVPYKDDWSKSYETKIAIHACVRDHVARDLKKKGGGTNVLYKDIHEVTKRVYAYCGAKGVQLP